MCECTFLHGYRDILLLLLLLLFERTQNEMKSYTKLLRQPTNGPRTVANAKRHDLKEYKVERRQAKTRNNKTDVESLFSCVFICLESFCLTNVLKKKVFVLVKIDSNCNDEC